LPSVTSHPLAGAGRLLEEDVSRREGSRRVARGAAILVIAISALAAIGWLFHIAPLRSIVIGWPAMTFNGAVCFMATTVALLLRSRDRYDRRTHRTARVLTMLVGAITVATLIERFGGRDLGIDQLIVSGVRDAGTPFPGRMPPRAAINFLLLVIAIEGLDAPSRWVRMLREPFAILVLLVSVMLSAGYLFSDNQFYSVGGYPMAVNTAVGFLLLSTAILAARPDEGAMAVLTASTHAGQQLRRLLPMVLLGPLALGWLRLEGERAGLYGTEFGVALTATTTIAAVAAALFWYAHSQGAAEIRARARLGDQHFLADLSEHFRTATDRRALLFEVATKTGLYLRASRCMFIEVDQAAAVGVVHRDFHTEGLSSAAGELPFSAFSPDAIVSAVHGRTLVSHDTSREAPTAAHYTGGYGPAGFRSRIAVPLLREGHWVASFFVSANVPRVWEPREVALVEAAAERAWVWCEHLAAAETLRARDERIRALVDASAQIVWSVAPGGGAAEDSPSWRAFTGQSREEWLGDGWRRAVHPDDLPSMLAAWSQAAAMRTTFARELRLRHHTGEWRWMASRAVPLLNDEGEIREWIGMSSDVTDRHRAEEGQRERERLEERARFFDLSIDLVCIAKDGKFLEVSPAFTQVLGYSREELTQIPFMDLVHPDDCGATHDRLSTFTGGQLNREFTNRYRTKNGVYRSIQWRSVPSEGAVYALGRDVTDEIAAREALESRERSLARNLKERDALLKEVHHRVKNNLQVIASLINLQKRQLSDLPSRNALEECQARIQAIALVHERLYQTNDYSEIPFSEYVKSLVHNISHAVDLRSKSIALTLDVDEIVLPVDKAVPCGLIVNELMTNAAKHAYPGRSEGTITIRFRQEDRHTGVLTVGDDGVGLPADFDLDKTSSLGLQLVTTLTRQLGGRLVIGRASGAQFSVTFPLDDGA
jgi:PAS domain S-box-containing protein